MLLECHTSSRKDVEMWSCRLGIYCNMELVMSLRHILDPFSAQNGIWSSQTALSISWASTQLDGGKARSWDRHLGFSWLAHPAPGVTIQEVYGSYEILHTFLQPAGGRLLTHPFPTLSKTGHSSQTPGLNGGDFVDPLFCSGFQFPWSNLNASPAPHPSPELHP